MSTSSESDSDGYFSCEDGKSYSPSKLLGQKPTRTPSRTGSVHQKEAPDDTALRNKSASANVPSSESTEISGSNVKTPQVQSMAQGTPASRKFGIRRAFSDLKTDNSPSPPFTPTKASISQLKLKVALRAPRPTSTRRTDPLLDEVVVSDSDDEENAPLTDLESSQPSTRDSSLFDLNSASTSQTSVLSAASQASTQSLPIPSNRKDAVDISSPTFIPKNRAISAQSAHRSQKKAPKPEKRRPAETFSSVERVVIVEDDDDGGIFNSPVRPNRPKVDDRQIPNRAFLAAISSQSTISPAVQQLSGAPLATEIKPEFIAHCAQTQNLLDQKQIAWGVQYELARGVSHGLWKWEDVRSKLDELTGSNNVESAFKVKAVMRGTATKDDTRAPGLSVWRELDREQLAILENRSRGLGLMGPWEGDPDWHGGQVQQLARVGLDHNGRFIIQLEPMEKRRSHRFARYASSRRILQIKIPDDIMKKKNALVRKYLTNKFILCGRVFVPFCSKDNGAYMLEINQEYERTAQEWCGDQYRHSLSDFIKWHNPLELNGTQAISKWVTRFALGLSNSVPAFEVEERNVFFLDDIYASDWKGKKAPAEKIMTDGACFLNRAAMSIVKNKLGYSSLPTALQGRFAGAKGMWFIHPHDDCTEPRIWIRDSQNKIKLTYLDKAHRIFDLLCASRPFPAIALSQQSIYNLWYNGVPADVLIKMLEDGLEEAAKSLMDWERPHAMVFLCDAINKCGNVSGARNQRLAAGISRALGFSGRDWGHDSIEVKVSGSKDEVDMSPTVYTGRNEYSGAPLALHESALELIQAGFHPGELKFLREKIYNILNQGIKSAVEKFRIPIADSLGALVIPDPLGVLEEGQIYYRSSQPIPDPQKETLWLVLTGEVLLGRYPIRLPSDMQKVLAVDIPELYDWPDVVIVSTKGTQSMMSFLSGGDMDGDEVIIIREPKLVKPFRNHAITLPPPDLFTNFEKEVETVPAFCERANKLTLANAQVAFQETLLLSLNESKMGMYSLFHDAAIQKYGYDDERSIRLAYIFNTLLDASKTGHRLKAGIYEADSKALNGLPPIASDSILGLLEKAGKKKGDEIMAQYETIFQKTNGIDKDLQKPYNAANDNAIKIHAEGSPWKFCYDELKKIRNLVDNEAKVRYHKACRKGSKSDESTKSKKPRRPKVSDDDLMLAATRKFAEEIPDMFLIHNVNEVKASYAYYSCPDSPFAFQMAFRELCKIKASASSGGIAPLCRLFDECKTFNSSCLKALSRNDDLF